MKSTAVSVLTLFLLLAQAPSGHAALCASCTGKAFIASIGACKVCQATTSSGAFKLCKTCSAKLAQCEACQHDLKDAGPSKEKEANPPAATFTSPGGKVYPAGWGAPPRIQTRDLRPLPGGYGSGSSTLAGWIQKNLDQDAKAPADPEKKKPEAGHAEEIKQIEKKIAEMEEFATRARFTPEGMKKHQDELAALRKRLQELKGETKPVGK